MRRPPGCNRDAAIYYSINWYYYQSRLLLIGIPKGGASGAPLLASSCTLPCLASCLPLLLAAPCCLPCLAQPVGPPHTLPAAAPWHLWRPARPCRLVRQLGMQG